MADSKAHTIAQTLMQIANNLAPGAGGADSATAALGGRAGGVEGLATLIRALCPADQPGSNAKEIAALVRALCPATGGTTNANQVAALVQALCPADAVQTDAVGVARLIQALSPASDAGGRAGLQKLIAALCPVVPSGRVSAIADVVAGGDVKKIADALRTEASRGGTGADTMTARQHQAIEVMRELWPVEKQPKMTPEKAAELIRALCPADRPAQEVAGLITALSPAADKTVSNAGDAAKFIRALCPAGDIPPADAAALIRALSPADNKTARRTENVAEVIRALCPAGSQPTTVGALIRALSPAVDLESRPADIAKLIRELSPAEVTPVQVIRTLSPAAPE